MFLSVIIFAASDRGGRVLAEQAVDAVCRVAEPVLTHWVGRSVYYLFSLAFPARLSLDEILNANSQQHRYGADHRGNHVKQLNGMLIRVKIVIDFLC